MDGHKACIRATHLKLLESANLVSRLRTQVEGQQLVLGQEVDRMSQLFTGPQLAKFMTWIRTNSAAQFMLDESWQRPTRATNAGQKSELKCPSQDNALGMSASPVAATAVSMRSSAALPAAPVVIARTKPEQHRVAKLAMAAVESTIAAPNQPSALLAIAATAIAAEAADAAEKALAAGATGGSPAKPQTAT